MKFQITITVSRGLKSDSSDTTNAYKNQYWQSELSESIQSLRKELLHLDGRLLRLENKKPWFGKIRL